MFWWILLGLIVFIVLVYMFIHGHHLTVAQGQLMRQRADAGADLQNGAVGILTAVVGNILHHRAIAQKVLPELLAEIQRKHRHRLPDGLGVT